MIGRILLNQHQFNSPNNANQIKQLSLHQAQELIYQFLIENVKNHPPKTVLLEFKNLFIYCNNTTNPDVVQALYKIIFKNQEDEFRNTIKRSSYILINNWASKRKYNYIQELIQILTETPVKQHTLSPSLNRLKTWLANFIKSRDYQELKLFVSPYTAQDRGHWIERYSSYLLVPQYLNFRNPIEQREIAKNVSKRLKEKFRLDLAMYTARGESPTFQEETSSNPTSLGKEVIFLIKQVISKKILFGYINYANIFLRQTKDFNYKVFKKSLHKYLIFSVNRQNALDPIYKKLSEKLENLYSKHHQENLTPELLLRTCRRLIDFFTTEDGKEPSFIFILLITQESPLTIVITLLKIILICEYAHTHLEVCLAKLIRYYENYSESECKWFIDFLEIFNIVFAIYTTNVEYNLVKVKDSSSNKQRVIDLDAYRVFSQMKGADMRGANLSGVDLSQADLNAADLRGANLSGADLSQANLSLAKLSRANLSSAILNGAKLTAADLNSADLRGASLKGANLRRADLRQAKLSRASLIATQLHYNDFQTAGLSSINLNVHALNDASLQHTTLQPVDLREANLSGADLRHTQLLHANLKGANLSDANLSEANLKGANLSDANLNSAELNHVNLCGADLNSAFLRRAKLNDANLSRANLSCADLSYAELSRLDLSGTDLSYALLRHVNLSSADLSNANLTGANLFSTDLSQTNVKGTQFRENTGLSEATKLELEQRGAIFEVYSS